MYSGLIGKTSPTVDVLTVLTGTWDERDAGDWHVVMTPFFTILTATLPEGQRPLAYKVKKPMPAILFGNSGNVTAIAVKPGQDAIVLPEAGVVQVQVFGDPSQLEAVR